MHIPQEVVVIVVLAVIVGCVAAACSGTFPATPPTRITASTSTAATPPAPVLNRSEALAVTANVLPFPECPSVVQQVQDLVGLDVTGLRAGVQRELPGILGCTHLNDMLRGLSDVPALVSIVGQ